MSNHASPRAQLRSAISKWFFVNGFVAASWVAHVPRQSVALEASPGPLGLALLCAALGAVLGMTAAPRTMGWIGPGRVAWVSGIVFTLLIPLPLLAWSVPVLGLALVVFGAMQGLMDVTMNAAAAECEQAVGRPIMSSFHGWFSVGMVAGIAGGVAVLAAGFSPAAHGAIVIGLMAVLLATSRPATCLHRSAADLRPSGLAGVSRRAIPLAGLAFVCLFLEGAMADWAGLLAVDFGAGPATAPLAFMAFTATWAGGRFTGDRLTAWAGDVAIVRAGGLLTAIGIGLALAVATPAAVATGSGIVGLGLANAVPILFRWGAATDPAGRGLALVTGIGYTGLLVGPPLVGFTAEAVGLPRAMLLVVAGGVLLTIGAVVLKPR